jgi:hypothetical protein
MHALLKDVNALIQALKCDSDNHYDDSYNDVNNASSNAVATCSLYSFWPSSSAISANLAIRAACCCTVNIIKYMTAGCKRTSSSTMHQQALLSKSAVHLLRLHSRGLLHCRTAKA